MAVLPFLLLCGLGCQKVYKRTSEAARWKTTKIKQHVTEGESILNGQ